MTGAVAPELLTIGYEGSTLAAVLDALSVAEVTVLIDIRALPQSRKPGFSKRQLAAGLDERGMRYLHLRDLGTPKPGRDAARRGDTATMHRIFAAQLATEARKPHFRRQPGSLAALDRASSATSTITRNAIARSSRTRSRP